MFNLFQKSAFALDISDFSAEVLELDHKKRVRRFGRILLKKGIIEDGFVINKEELAQEIDKLLRKSKVKSKQAILSLPESKTFIYVFKVPRDVGKEQIDRVVRSEVEKTLPLDFQKIYWDYKIIEEGDKSKLTVLFVGTLKEIIDDYRQVLDSIGIKAVVFEPESLALGRALFYDSGIEGNVLVVDVGARTTIISFFDKHGRLKDSTMVKAAGEYFSRFIARSMKLSLREAEKVKRKVGFDEQKDRKISSILKKAANPILKEIKKVINYHKQKIDKILLVGGSAKLPKIKNYFSSSLGLKVEIGVSPLLKQLKTKSILFNTVAGLALRGTEKDFIKKDINLLSYKKEKKGIFYKKSFSEKRKNYRILEILMILIVGILIWLVYVLFLRSSLVDFQNIQTPPLQETPSSETMPSLIPTPSSVNQTSSFQILPHKPTTTQATATQATTSQEKESDWVIIQETETGWLNVRMGPGTDYPIIQKVYPGESYPLLDEIGKWYKIKLEDNKTGWISIRYATMTKK